ncbi:MULTISPECIES: RidA family protein [Brucella/Ochrobactrum group]|jgi:enamine deaminase RidA (YjgF/YER057c/UK114 family)|uniref:RidA family protein n=1 Tax=Brucella pseudintermedia TaxID=370111 RepID=A0ABY5UFH8_9HYPH|nr:MULTISPECIES: RidA family protein [Brucella/Ochrobactrum group]KAB2684634.1 RidA family protein [Brucella pseudintermedia]NKE74660.1 RidA family protein [Ochrobactrum sp. MC-1LL]UWL62089.1 RidA family protein [Brucella pseudintermedia]WPM82561.1 RidA family protein [Brucella pseudintermedia]
MSTLKHLLPQDMAAPFAAYSHGVKVKTGAEMIFCSGQLGIAPDGNVPQDVGAQAELCFENIRRILRDGGMDLADVVRINAYVTDRAYMRPYMDVRDRLFPQPAPASTLMIVSGFTREEFKVEIEVVAAR